jgi:hypothetical protein
MGCFCAVPEEFYCEVLLLDECKLTLTTQQQGIKVSTAGGAFHEWAARVCVCVCVCVCALRGPWLCLKVVTTDR